MLKPNPEIMAFIAAGFLVMARRPSSAPLGRRMSVHTKAS
jgi:hypothetical protein